MGFFGCFALGWVAGLEEQIVQLGHKTMVAYMFTNFGSIITAIGVWFGAGSTWGGLVAWIKTHCKVDLEKALLGSNVSEYQRLCQQIRDVVGYIPFMWEALVKHIIPPGLGRWPVRHLRRICYLAASNAWCLSFCFAAIIILVGFAAPDLYSWTF